MSHQHNPPQPSLSRLTPFAGHPLVVGVEPRVPDLVVAAAVMLARAASAPMLHFAYADPTRIVVERRPNGTVRHEAMDPDALDDTWKEREADIRRQLSEQLDGTWQNWDFVYLAGRPDRALTHLARAVDAAAIIVGTRAPGPGARMREVFEGSVAVHLAHHQHRPVITIPLSVVDWKDTANAWER